MSMIKYWNRAHEAVGSPFLDIFLTQLKQGPERPDLTPCLEPESAPETSRGSFQLSSPVNLQLFQEPPCTNLQQSSDKENIIFDLAHHMCH